jgi:hypothetical protein
MKKLLICLTSLFVLAFTQVNAQQVLFKTYSTGNPANKTKAEVIDCPKYVPQQLCEEFGACYGISYELEGQVSNRIEKKYCVYSVSGGETIQFEIGFDTGSDLNPVLVRYSYNQKTRRVQENVLDKMYNNIEKDTSPNRHYDCKIGDELGFVILKMFLSRQLFNAIYSNSKAFSWMDFKKTKQELVATGLYSY